MRKPAVAYALTVASLLFLLSQFPNTPPHPNSARRLHRHVAFDPLVNKLERKAEEQGLIDVKAFKKSLGDELAILESYFGEEGGLNMTERLMYLFPLLDQSPTDGFVSFRELEVWNRQQAVDRLVYDTERRMRVYDKDEDGEVSLSEFLSDVSEDEKDWNNKEQGKPGWWKDQFVNADRDGNGSLNETEFNDFLHPEDSSNPKVQIWLQSEKMSEMDQNQDGKLSFREFYDETHDLLLNTPDFETVKDVDSNETKAEQKFAELDVNKDKYLTAEELKPILYHLSPGELSHATYYTKYLMHEADDNKDGKLTLDEMLNHQHAFYSVVFEEDPGDDYNDDHEDNEDDDHDEFR